MKTKDFTVGKSAFVIFFNWRSRISTNYVFEVTVTSVGSKYVVVDTNGQLLPLKYTKGNKKDVFLSSVIEGGRIGKNHMLFPDEYAAGEFLKYLDLRNWFCRYVNWSSAGEFGTDGMSYTQLKAIEKILKDPQFAETVLGYEEFLEAMAG